MVKKIEDVFKLPFVLFEDRTLLPKTTGIYFVLTGNNVVYIGKAAGLFGFRGRWVDSHHKKGQLLQMSDVKIAYLEIKGEDEIEKLEQRYIYNFRPSMNRIPESWEWEMEGCPVSNLADVDMYELFSINDL